ncbi:MAG: PDZ domain-containing protein [Nitratireductor sp.]
MPEQTRGAIITDVTGDKANEEGLKDGDIILSVNQTPIGQRAGCEDRSQWQRPAATRSCSLAEHGNAGISIALLLLFANG